jgi:phosphate-selective porin OprO and OprP
MKYGLHFIAVPVIAIGMFPCLTFGQEPKKVPDGTDGLELTVRPADSSSKKLPANEFSGSLTTFKIGLGLIYDAVAYKQDDVFKQQMTEGGFNIEDKIKLRDFRVLGSGILRTKRSLSWKFAYMWDGDKETWLLRETGITIGVPELAGHVFVGRTKVGFSMVKVMNGHSPWTNERQMAVDAVPILADGIKWFGHLEKSRIFWNLGYFNDVFSEGQGFSTFAWQGVARVGWMPFYNPKENKLLHIAGEIEYGKPFKEKFTLKSRPESNPTPQLINTGEFETDKAAQVGFEAYYQNKKFMIGSELVMHNFFSSKSENHKFSGGDVMVSYFFTNTVRPYKTVGSIFGFIPVTKSVFKGGWGAIEGVLRVSTLNLNDRSIEGGKMWRITPMINWYMTRVMRMEFIYGYAILERYNKRGILQLFESRLQFTLM